MLATVARKNLEMKDWIKNNASICLFDKRRRERMILESGKLLFDIDRFTVGDDRSSKFKQELFSSYKALNPEKLLRVGLREWFAVSIDNMIEQQIVKKMNDRIFRRDTLDVVFSNPPEDTGVVFEWDANKWWYKRRVEFGAMSKSQWQERVKYFDITFEDNGKETKWKDGASDALPANFLFVDVDTFWLAEPPIGKWPDGPVDMKEFFAEMEKRNIDTVKRMVGILSN